jgi:D-alanyl-lipoteichoic acid acyltransferase DltB (MBOAT superfamily)
MLFNSFDFGIFFPVVAFIYFLLPQNFRWQWLLVTSCYFYSYFIPIYLLVVIFIDYWCAQLIEMAVGARRKKFLILSIFSTCLVLFAFKYFDFINFNVMSLARAIGWNYPIKNLSWILPIGLSFHTFQSLAYVIEVYQGRQKAERHFGKYALYVMYFPQLVAGPIERPQHLLHQFSLNHFFDYQRVTNGLKLVCWGLFKKIVIADRLALVVNSVYGDPTFHTGTMLLIATFFFTYQIYCDFSGYTDIARGASRILGIELLENFNFH